MPTSLELCAGAGGQALGLEWAGFNHIALVEEDQDACYTLQANRRHWNVIRENVRDFPRTRAQLLSVATEIDLLSAGIPCPPFSIAGHRLGSADDRDLFPEVLRLAELSEPKAILVENVRGLLNESFQGYRDEFEHAIEELGPGYVSLGWRLLQASDFGVPQLRPRAVFVALQNRYAHRFHWPRAHDVEPPTVGEVLHKEIASAGWHGADEWREQAADIAPTIVGGSKKHGGPDLGPTRARRAWAQLGVDGLGVADAPPPPDFMGRPKLTVSMVAALQGFPPTWRIEGRKTSAYRQVGNAFPPPVAEAVGNAVRIALQGNCE